MGLDRVRRQVQLLPDLPKGERALEQMQHRFLAFGERVSQRCGLRPARSLPFEPFQSGPHGLGGVRLRRQQQPHLIHERRRG
jgi:hypothetical protein